jgi:hypothetical protein
MPAGVIGFNCPPRHGIVVVDVTGTIPERKGREVIPDSL